MSTPTLSREAATNGSDLHARESGTRELVRFLSNPLRYLDRVREDEPQPTATWATEPKRGLRMKPVRRQ